MTAFLIQLKYGNLQNIIIKEIGKDDKSIENHVNMYENFIADTMY